VPAAPSMTSPNAPIDPTQLVPERVELDSRRSGSSGELHSGSDPSPRSPLWPGRRSQRGEHLPGVSHTQRAVGRKRLREGEDGEAREGRPQEGNGARTSGGLAEAPTPRGVGESPSLSLQDAGRRLIGRKRQLVGLRRQLVVGSMGDRLGGDLSGDHRPATRGAADRFLMVQPEDALGNHRDGLGVGDARACPEARSSG
jgi:hypothetical protein